MRVSLVCEDLEVDTVTSIIRKAGRIGPNISGWVYVSPIEQALPIGGDDADDPSLVGPTKEDK